MNFFTYNISDWERVDTQETVFSIYKHIPIKNNNKPFLSSIIRIIAHDLFDKVVLCLAYVLEKFMYY